MAAGARVGRLSSNLETSKGDRTMRDQMNALHPVASNAPVVITDNTASVGAIIDVQGFDALTYLIAAGTLADADATFAVLVEHADLANFSGAVAVPDEDLVGLEATAGFTFADDNETRKIGYRGAKRYVRLTITPSANAGAAPICAIALLGLPSRHPTPNPPT
jgi:hypothetical protein